MRGGEILDWCLRELLLDPKVFEFYRYYWPEQVEGGGVFECRENIMWTGHVLHVACLYEMLTGDDKYSQEGGLRVEESDGTGEQEERRTEGAKRRPHTAIT